MVEASQLLQRMMAHGVRVLRRAGSDLTAAYRADGRSAGRGSGRRGAMHSKLMLADRVLIIGSTNFTTSSQANVEVSVRTSLSIEEAAEVKRRIFEVFDGADPFELRELSRGSSSTELMSVPIDLGLELGS